MVSLPALNFQYEFKEKKSKRKYTTNINSKSQDARHNSF